MIENLFTFVRTLGNQRIEGKKFFTTQIGVLGTLSDGTGAVGTAGKVLSSTGTGVEWVTVGSSNVADLDDLTDVVITTASTGQLLRFNGTSWVNWTPNFLTSYGSLNDLSDAVIATPTTGQLLRYNGTNWVNWTHNFLTTSSNLNDLANVSVAGPTNGQILRYNAGTSLWIADDETEPPIPTLQQVTTAGNTTTDGISAASFTATGFISGGNITGTKVTTPTVEFNGAISTNSVYQVDQGEPNPNVFYAKWNGDVQFTVNGDGYAIARTGYKVTGATGGFLKADGTIDTSTYLTSYTETQTLDAVTDLGNTTTNRITVGGVTISAGGDVTSPVIYSPTLWAVNGPIKIMADESGSLIPDQGDPANPVIYFEWKEDPLGHIDTDGKVTFNGFKTPSGTSSGFLKADGSIDTNTYLTYVAPYALDDLTDVSVGNPQDGEFLKYDDITGEWISAAIPTPTLDSVTTAGNTTANTIDVGGVTTPYVQFEEVATPLESHRSVNWGEDHNSLEVYYADEKHFDVGQDQMWYVKNRTEDTLPKGTVVMAAGAVGNSGKIAVAPLVADGTVSGRYAVGILMDDVRADEFGFAMTQGTIRGINTGEFTEGDTLYPDPLNPGALTNVEPASPALKLPIAFVVTSAQNGAIAVRMTQGLDLHEVHDVQITDGANGQLLRLQSGVWTNWTPNYLTAETDPVFTASAAATISTTNISNWNTAYGWGDHALAGYLTTYENNYISDVRISEFIVTFTGIGNAFNGDVDFSALPFAPVTHNHAIAEITGLETALDGKQPVGNYITTETDPTVPDHVKAITEQNIIDWDKAYGWGNHADYGYLTSLPTHTHAIADVTGLQTALDGKMPYYHGAISGDPGTAINGVTRIYPTANGPIGAGHFTVFTALQDSVNYGWQFTSVGNDAYFRSKDTTWGGWQAIATQTYVNTAIANLVDSAPSTLDTLNELAAALGDDPNFATTVTNSIATKVPQTRTLTINGTALDLSADRSWTIDSADGYISNVRLVETTLTFEGEGNAFAGDVDLSTLPFAPQGSYLTAEADTLATVVARGSTTSSPISVIETTGGGFLFRTNSGWGAWARNGFSFANGAGSVMKALGAYGDVGTSVGYMYLGTDYQTNNLRVYDNRVYIPGLDLAISNSNGSHGAGTYFRGDGTHFVLGLNNGNTFYLNYGNDGGALRAYGNLHLATNSARMSTARPDGIAVGGLGWYSDTFYVAGHPDFGPFAGNDVRVYGFGANLYFGNATAGDVARINSSGTFTYGGSEIATRTWVQAQGYLTSETDSQTLDWDGASKNLSITNGNTVTLDGLATEEFVTSQGYLTSLPSHNHDDRYYTESESDSRYFIKSGSWLGDLASYGYTREVGIQMTGGSEFVILSKAGQGYTLVDGSYLAYEGGGFYSSNNSAGNTLLGFYADTTSSVNFNTSSVKANGNTIWHAGNDGSGSGLDADLFDGIDSSRFVYGNSGTRRGTNLISNWNQTDYPDVAFLSAEAGGSNAPNGDYTYGLQYSFHRSGAAYRTQFVTSLYSDLDIWVRNSRDSDVWTSWKKLIHSGNIGSQSVSYATSSGNSVSTDQTNFSALFIEDAPVATKEYVTSQGYLTSLPAHNHDDRYYTESESDSRFVNASGDTMTGELTLKYSTDDSSDYNGLFFAPYNDAAGLNDYIIKAASNRGVFGRKSFGWHVHSESAFGVYSNGWVKLFGVEGGTGNTQVFGNLTVSGSITESSSIRYKKDVVDIESASSKVEQLKPVRYKKIKDDQEEIGLIAEDVAELFPEVVKYDNEGRPDGVNYSRLSVILLKAVQELSQEVNELKKKLN